MKQPYMHLNIMYEIKLLEKSVSVHVEPRNKAISSKYGCEKMHCRLIGKSFISPNYILIVTFRIRRWWKKENLQEIRP